MTPLPQSPPFLLGVINVRGEPLSVLDLRKFFNLPGSPLSDLNRVIIVKDGTMIFGILVDRIREIRFFTEEKILQSKVNIAGLPGEYIAGVTPERVILLDAKSLLNDRAIIVNQTH
jgi:purine-binding chemotaxis protein CheW